MHLRTAQRGELADLIAQESKMQTRTQSLIEILIAQFIGSLLMFIELWAIDGGFSRSLFLVLLFKTQSTIIFYLVRRKHTRRLKHGETTKH